MINTSLATIRSYGNRIGLQFGLHCATHQIRVILISGVVITSLFYPALALYTSSQPSLSIIGTSSGFHAQQDLVDVWSRYDNLRVREDAVSRARCGVGRTVRVERILIQSLLPDDDSALNQQILLSTLKLEQTLNDLVSSRCVKRADGHCLVLSPLEFWNHDKSRLLSDVNILDTLSTSRNISVGGIPLSPQMVLAGRESGSDFSFDFAMYLALTYFFPETDCLGKSDHLNWLQTVQDAKAFNAEIIVKPEEPFLLALELRSSASEAKGWTAISALLYLAYISFFVYVSWSMRQMKTVHSRVGITFTALVEIAVSTVTSLSVCALVGFKVTMVPWELLPIMILFVGAENMFNLVDAVGKTHVTLPVKQRIAEGLSHAGTSNTLKVVFYNAVLGVIAFFSGGAIRQFCSFAVVVLVAHWFLAHTFFLAVLSIDMQRLELEELLRQDPGLIPAVPFKSSHAMPKTNWQKQASILQALFRGRARKNLSLFLLLATTATLYYATLPSETVLPFTPPVQRGALLRTAAERNPTGVETLDPAWQIWKSLNPGETVLHLRVESPTILTFRPDVDDINTLPKFQRPRLRSFRSLIWLFKIMVLPISATMVVLYGLLLYLLKDAELLEAQKHRAHVEEKPLEQDHHSLCDQVSFSTLPRTFTSDVELIAASKDGHVVITAGLQNEIVIWHLDEQSHLSIDATDVLLRSASSSTRPSTVTSVAMSGNGEYCAVGTGAGVIAVWAIEYDRVIPFPHMYLHDSAAGVVDMQFLSSRKGTKTPPQSRPTSPMEPITPVSLLAAYENGIAAKWAVNQLPVAFQLRPSSASVTRPHLLKIAPRNTLLVAFFLDDGKLELQEVSDQGRILSPDFSVQAGNPNDCVTNAYVCRTLMGDETRTIVCAATEAGAISLWDGLTGELIRTLDDAYGKVSQLTLSPVPVTACRLCTRLRPESLVLAFSVNQVVHFFKIYHNDTDRRCACPPAQTRRYDSVGRSSRSGSMASTNSPLVRHSRLSSSFETSFPVSAHGVHSRRASEKDFSRRVSTSEGLSPTQDDGDVDHTIGPADGLRGSSLPASFWFGVHVVVVADTICERGEWGLCEGKIMGVRRRPRSHGKTPVKVDEHCGLSSATLERWEIWIFEPSDCEVQASPLSFLVLANEATCPPSSSVPVPVPRLPFTRVSPLVTTRYRAFSGFGNTLGVLTFLST